MMIYRIEPLVPIETGSARWSSAGYYAYFLLSTGSGHVTIFYAALLLPFFAGRKLYLGFRDRDRARAERAAAAEALRAAEEWRSARRW